MTALITNPDTGRTFRAYDVCPVAAQMMAKAGYAVVVWQSAPEGGPQ